MLDISFSNVYLFFLFQKQKNEIRNSHRRKISSRLDRTTDGRVEEVSLIRDRAYRIMGRNGEGRRGNAKSSLLHFREPLSHFLPFFSPGSATWRWFANAIIIIKKKKNTIPNYYTFVYLYPIMRDILKSENTLKIYIYIRFTRSIDFWNKMLVSLSNILSDAQSSIICLYIIIRQIYSRHRHYKISFD